MLSFDVNIKVVEYERVVFLERYGIGWIEIGDEARKIAKFISDCKIFLINDREFP